MVGANQYVARNGTILSVDTVNGTVDVKITASDFHGTRTVAIPSAWITPDGSFSGGFPSRGTPVQVSQMQGGGMAIVGFGMPDKNTSTIFSKLREGGWVTSIKKNDLHISLTPDDGVELGSTSNFLHTDPGRKLYSSVFPKEMHFSEAHRQVIGPLTRDKNANSSRSSKAVYDHAYERSLNPIGLDPEYGQQPINPTFTEARSLYYEFNDSFSYTDDNTITEHLKNKKNPEPDMSFRRRQSRADTLSLALDEPNYLIEETIGTVVDIYGNLLDLNRNILPSGKIDALSFAKTEKTKDEVFKGLREQARKSIAYHFELNARKPEKQGPPNNALSLGYRKDVLKDGMPDVSSSDDYARVRSRFFVDIDKEGQFKINIPASSEVGNVPLLTRYENYSVVDGAKNNKDRGVFIRNDEKRDILHDAHGVGAITLKAGKYISNTAQKPDDALLSSYVAPTDRIATGQIQLGTAYHSLNVSPYASLPFHSMGKPYSTSGNASYPESLLNNVIAITEMVSSEVIVSGDTANAGGRSGTISLDGFLSLNIGANTVDRQSLWLDTAGGIVANIGRDKYDRSLATTFDGDVLVSIGGKTISNDSRFQSTTGFYNEMKAGTLDIRVSFAGKGGGGSFHIIRVEPQGILIHTPGRLDVVSEGEMRFKSANSNMYFDAENIYFYSGQSTGGRLLNRKDKIPGQDNSIP